jgi:hypothetical protein
MIYGVVTVSKDISGSITIPFPYDSQLVSKIKKIAAHKLHPIHVIARSPDLIGTTKQSHDSLNLKWERIKHKTVQFY